jgi:hypothetical protein
MVIYKSYEKNSDSFPLLLGLSDEFLQDGLFQPLEDESLYSLQLDIKRVRRIMRWLLDRIAECETAEDRLPFEPVWEYGSNLLAKMLRAQKRLELDEETEFNRTLKNIITALNIEWCLS